MRNAPTSTVAREQAAPDRTDPLYPAGHLPLKGRSAVLAAFAYHRFTGAYSSATTPLLNGAAEISSGGTFSPGGTTFLPWPTGGSAYLSSEPATLPIAFASVCGAKKQRIVICGADVQM
ncbi:hypothetical protein [Mesorhizobium sp.]|uniref:hypothetical protein n=1 Tax=Mesorhizobium sp. TaxID=1871066 RepID=UPI0025D448C4|nr:hypothetical protein [Mesorhizobium sp.]